MPEKKSVTVEETADIAAKAVAAAMGSVLPALTESMASLRDSVRELQQSNGGQRGRVMLPDRLQVQGAVRQAIFAGEKRPYFLHVQAAAGSLETPMGVGRPAVSAVGGACHKLTIFGASFSAFVQKQVAIQEGEGKWLALGDERHFGNRQSLSASHVEVIRDIIRRKVVRCAIHRYSDSPDRRGAQQWRVGTEILGLYKRNNLKEGGLGSLRFRFNPDKDLPLAKYVRIVAVDSLTPEQLVQIANNDLSGIFTIAEEYEAEGRPILLGPGGQVHVGPGEYESELMASMERDMCAEAGVKLASFEPAA